MPPPLGAVTGGSSQRSTRPDREYRLPEFAVVLCRQRCEVETAARHGRGRKNHVRHHHHPISIAGHDATDE